MNRKLRKCACCGQWFNTTSAIMLQHYLSKHPGSFAPAIKAARELREAFAAVGDSTGVARAAYIGAALATMQMMSEWERTQAVARSSSPASPASLFA